MVFSFIAPQGLKFMVAYGAYFIALVGFLCVRMQTGGDWRFLFKSSSDQPALLLHIRILWGNVTESEINFVV